MAILGGEQRNQVVRQRLARDGGVGAVEGQAVLKFADDQHAWRRAGQPLLDFLDHLLPVAVDLAHQAASG